MRDALLFFLGNYIMTIISCSIFYMYYFYAHMHLQQKSKIAHKSCLSLFHMLVCLLLHVRDGEALWPRRGWERSFVPDKNKETMYELEDGEPISRCPPFHK
jgi:hypothetical protein